MHYVNSYYLVKLNSYYLVKLNERSQCAAHLILTNQYTYQNDSIIFIAAWM